LNYKIALLPGDGIGPEVVVEGVRALEAVSKRFGHSFTFTSDNVGAAAIDAYGTALRPETLKQCRSSHAILFGAVGDPGGDDARIIREALLPLRRTFNLFANIRPVKARSALAHTSTLKPETLRDVDLVVVRELTGGLYFGRPKRQWQSNQGRQAVDTLRYSEREIERILRVGFNLARQRRGKLTSIDKANALETSRLWRQMATEMAGQYPDVTLNHMYVDACAMQLIRWPADFDVIVTENMFGDILTDEASMLAGSMGMLPSASLGRRRKNGTAFGMYEPIHGTAPDIAGQGKANPTAMILSAAMMLRLSLGLPQVAEVVERAVDQAISQGYRTPDIAGPGAKAVNTEAMGSAIADLIATV
jgi:3-isopropylmalate dehydrogenase